MKINIENIISKPTRFNIRKPPPEIAKLRGAAQEIVSLFFSTQIPGFGKAVPKDIQNQFVQPKSAPDMMVDREKFYQTTGIRLSQTQVLKDESVAFIELKQTGIGSVPIPDITSFDTSRAGAAERFKEIERRRKVTINPQGQQVGELDSEATLELILLPENRSKFDELILKTAQKFENYFLVNFIDDQKQGKKQVQLLFAANPLMKVDFKKMQAGDKATLLKYFSFRTRAGGYNPDGSVKRFRTSVKPTPLLEASFKPQDITKSIVKAQATANMKVSQAFLKFAQNYIRQKAAEGAIKQDSLENIYSFLYAFFNEFKEGGLTPFVQRMKLEKPPKTGAVNSGIVITGESMGRKQKSAQRFISGVQLSRLVQKRLGQTMRKSGEPQKPDLTERSGRFRNSVQILANYKKSVIAYKYNPLYESLKRYGYTPDEQVGKATREVVQSLFARAFSIVRA